MIYDIEALRAVAQDVLSHTSGTGMSYVSVPRGKMAALAAAVLGSQDALTVQLSGPGHLKRLPNGGIVDVSDCPHRTEFGCGGVICPDPQTGVPPCKDAR